MKAQRILLLGADGFLGRHLKTALLAAGHDVVDGVHRPTRSDQIAIDFGRDHSVADWRPRLAGIDSVINCVGLFRETPTASFDAIHVTAPRTLYAACRETGARRVLLVSALGAAADANTRYWQSKAEGEVALRESGIDWCIVRPSLVYGDDGASTRLFATLAQLPLLALPAQCGNVQPIHVDDFAAGCVALLMQYEQANRAFDATGPTSLPFADYLQLLGRKQWRLRIPQALCRLIARMAEALPGALLTRDSLTMLATGNTADGHEFAGLLARPLREPASFISPALRLRASVGVARGWLRGGLAFVWFATAVVSLWVYPAEASHRLLAACHVPPLLFEPMRIGAAGLDALFGVLTLCKPSRRLWQAQLALIAFYSVIIALCLPEFLIHPFGPLTKNAGLLAALLALLATEEK
ncbi:SDR family oxidoreductase [Jeongeupia naejangsanensis]|uniref:SDR family oxidoreductase n=1 Tax=Jeongeupia naejangsanensis TaxID=613195 RepID=A0ABS2BIF1_9NEIS|nr:SDR family oxidoreductase [Jeongeupia naejangsanensis]MBM3115381.1 SDR family oxidoreductase [Jeongeupia naejangsanensis]